MRKQKKLKVTYGYIEPKNPEEKAEQQRKLDSVFDIIFKKLLEKSI